MKFERVAIVGVGLLGGSVGKALLTRKLAKHVVGIGRDPDRMWQAQAAGATTEMSTDLATGVAKADLVVVCTPVDLIPDFVRQVARCAPGALVTDVGSTKKWIVDQLGGLRFVGSHPLAGGERSGAAAADADLFVDRLAYVTPTEASAAEDVDRASEFWASLGAKVIVLSPAEHDRLTAATSHLPHLVAAALALATSGDDLDHCGSGWRDTTRVALGDPQVWRPIFETNRQQVLKALDAFERTLASLRSSLGRASEPRDKSSLAELLALGKSRCDEAWQRHPEWRERPLDGGVNHAVGS